MKGTAGLMNTFSPLWPRQSRRLGPILVTDTFVQQVEDIYKEFTPQDHEYPTLGVVIQGAPIFIRCVRIPDVAIDRHQVTDYMRMDHPEAQRVWKQQLISHGGKVRFSTTHIHPMNLPALSGYDKQQFEAVRTAPNTLNPYESDHPMPVILINLNEGALELLGFWVYHAKAIKVEVVQLPDNDERVVEAFERAEALPFFSTEARIAESANNSVRKGWTVEMGCHRRTGQKVLRAVRVDGAKVMLRFAPGVPFGLTDTQIEAGKVSLASYVDWSRLLDDLARLQQAGIPADVVVQPTTHQAEDGTESEQQPHVPLTLGAEGATQANPEQTYRTHMVA